MGHQVRPYQTKTWRSGDGERVWLSMLIDTMEEVSRSQARSVPCDPAILIALRAQLARPASSWAYYGSHFSLRN